MTSSSDPLELDTPEFAADPFAVYDALRAEFGSVAPVTIGGRAVAVVLAHGLAREILSDPKRFPDHPGGPAPSGWVCAGTARPLRACGETADGPADRGLLHRVDLAAVRDATIDASGLCMSGFAKDGQGSADLVGQYALPVSCMVIGGLLGITSLEFSGLYDAVLSRCVDQVVAMRDVRDPAAVHGAAATLVEVVAEVVAVRRREPGRDVMSSLCAESADDYLIARRIARVFAAAVEPTWTLLASTLARMAGDTEFGSAVAGGPLAFRDAIDEVLYRDPPIDLLATYPRSAMALAGQWLPQGQPLLVSLVAANTDPAIHHSGDDAYLTGNRAHLGWGTGARSCPAPELATLISTTALEQLIDYLPDIVLAETPAPILWRPVVGRRAPAVVSVRFAPSRWALGRRAPAVDSAGLAPDLGIYTK
ncbi:hypothetical protein ACWEKT_26910 [Nocardia takedensis]